MKREEGRRRMEEKEQNKKEGEVSRQEMEKEE
jgi:hypothetical protein